MITRGGLGKREGFFFVCLFYLLVLFLESDLRLFMRNGGGGGTTLKTVYDRGENYLQNLIEDYNFNYHLSYHFQTSPSRSIFSPIYLTLALSVIS